ncbi:hypothetical protein [Methylobacterium sp. R2-1]|nr:hypothetical protein [Methylobacterium sp. R2-1]MBB2963365.1 putative Co/Zn/Cd cation transporter (cation efflux family) [Methylobacterium sp. R2-1]
MNDEQRILRVSVVATVTLAIAGVTVGLAAGATAIVFDPPNLRHPRCR